MISALSVLPAKLDQPDHPIGMGLAFVALVMVFGFIGVVMLLVGVMRTKRRTTETIDYPVLLKPEDEINYRPTHGGRPTPPRQ